MHRNAGARDDGQRARAQKKHRERRSQQGNEQHRRQQERQSQLCETRQPKQLEHQRQQKLGYKGLHRHAPPTAAACGSGESAAAVPPAAPAPTQASQLGPVTAGTTPSVCGLLLPRDMANGAPSGLRLPPTEGGVGFFTVCVICHSFTTRSLLLSSPRRDLGHSPSALSSAMSQPAGQNHTATNMSFCQTNGASAGCSHFKRSSTYGGILKGRPKCHGRC